MGLKPIALSFKNTSEDKELYYWILSHSNKSGFIKDIMRTVMNNEKNIFPTKKESSNAVLIDMDF